MKRFKYLSQKIQSNDIVITDPLTRLDSIQSQIAKYVGEVRRPTSTTYEDGLTFWASRRSSYDTLAPTCIAEDLIAVLESQAYCMHWRKLVKNIGWANQNIGGRGGPRIFRWEGMMKFWSIGIRR